MEAEHLSSLQDLLRVAEVSVDLAGSLQVPSDESIELADSVHVKAIAMPAVEARSLPAFERPLAAQARDVSLLNKPPAVRVLAHLTMNVPTQGWRFPAPGEFVAPPVFKLTHDRAPETDNQSEHESGNEAEEESTIVMDGIRRTRLRPPSDMVMFKDRLLYLLQPPLEDIFHGKQVQLPFPPYPYQIKGIAFLMPRHAALLADEMGLGKTAQVIIALRLLLQSGLIRRALVVCPKPLVINWTRELKTWADDVPFEVIGGDTQTRRAQWFASKTPLKLVNYELLTRDAALVADEAIHFDVVVLDEAQRIKNRDSKTAEAVRGIARDRSWAMTGTPIENRVEDLISIFAFVDPERIPPDSAPKLLPELTRDCILRRVKEEVAADMPPKLLHDAFLELTPAQRESYDRAEQEGVVHLNDLGDTITVQHVFELVMRLKQICNFDPVTGDSAKLEQLLADIAEVADNGRKAIVFSQWVEPLERLARALTPHGPLLFHGKIPHRERQPILDRFKAERDKHVLLMSYGAGSVGLNLQFANYVFLFDRWWNPAVEDQAIGRAHRIGQKDKVLVKRLVIQGTIEERIAEVLRKKRELFEEMIGQNGPPPALGLTEADIFGLFKVQARPKRLAA
ncbi:MAG: DEAD/DEAH box helicase [Gemmataceae bacterium]|nr:DEAD/DEAH box helicase [Gemmataceae bacterium]